jgi:hypothetical protein
MLISVAVVCATLALFVSVGAAPSLMLAMLISLVLLHVVGNALGTRLRDRHETEYERLERGDSDAYGMPANPRAIAPAQRLHENTSVRRPWLIAAVVCAAAGGSIGGIGIATIVGEKLTVAGLIVGVCSAAVLGGFFGFMACSLWTVARNALREALETHELENRE